MKREVAFIGGPHDGVVFVATRISDECAPLVVDDSMTVWELEDVPPDLRLASTPGTEIYAPRVGEGGRIDYWYCAPVP